MTFGGNCSAMRCECLARHRGLGGSDEVAALDMKLLLILCRLADRCEECCQVLPELCMLLAPYFRKDSITAEIAFKQLAANFLLVTTEI